MVDIFIFNPRYNFVDADDKTMFFLAQALKSLDIIAKEALVSEEPDFELMRMQNFAVKHDLECLLKHKKGDLK